MVRLLLSTPLRVQNICQAAQASDNFDDFGQLENFDHETMKKN